MNYESPGANRREADRADRCSVAVVGLAGGPFAGSLNLYPVGPGVVCTIQVDDVVFAVGQARFDIARYALADWLGNLGLANPQIIEADDAEQSLEILNLVREGALLWQCGGCDGWIYTSNRPRIGVLQCSSCGEAGVDFRHADRHVGGSTEDVQ